MSDDRTVIDVLEEILGVPFDPRWTKKISIDVLVARRLAQAVRPFYKGLRFPEKDRGEMRPYLFPFYRGDAAGSKLWDEFVRPFTGDEYTFSPSRDTDLLLFLKPFLLYSHGICFLDPLPGLLDHFFGLPSESSSFEKARLPGLAHLLLEYVKIADLIRHRIVVPISIEMFGNYLLTDFHLSDREKREVKREVIDRLPHFARMLKQSKSSGARFLGSLINDGGSLIKEHLWLIQDTGNRIDLYLPQAALYMSILQGLLRAASYRYTSKEIFEPFNVGILADLANLDTSQISIMDIIAIRSENAFGDYRRVLQGILRRLQDREGKFSDLESEFAVAAREEMAECDERIKQLTKKSNVLKDTLRNLDRVLIGGATGAVGGLLAGSPEIAVLGAGAGAAMRPLYDIVRGAWAASPSSAARASLRQHFLALDLRDSD